MSKSKFNTHYFGISKEMGQKVSLTGPSWDCDWYWGMGYLGNEDCHFHLSSWKSKGNRNMFDALREDYDLCTTLQDDKKLWTFCELMCSAYTLQKAAEVIGKGGSHYTTNPCKDSIVQPQAAKYINEVSLPAIFQAVDDLFAE